MPFANKVSSKLKNFKNLQCIDKGIQSIYVNLTGGAQRYGWQFQRWQWQMIRRYNHSC